MSGCPCYAVVFAKGFHHAGVHYIDADEHQATSTSVTLYRDGNVVWSAPAKHVKELFVFDNRVDAQAWHKQHKSALLQGRGHASGTAKTPRSGKSGTRSPMIEGVQIRIVEP